MEHRLFIEIDQLTVHQNYYYWVLMPQMKCDHLINPINLDFPLMIEILVMILYPQIDPSELRIILNCIFMGFNNFNVFFMINLFAVSIKYVECQMFDLICYFMIIVLNRILNDP